MVTYSRAQSEPVDSPHLADENLGRVLRGPMKWFVPTSVDEDECVWGLARESSCSCVRVRR